MALIGRFRELFLCCAALVGFAPEPALEQQASEASVKAALVFKFASYVEWPLEALPSPDAPLALCVLGADEVAAELETLVRGRFVNAHPVVARRLKEGEGLAGCHVAVVGRRESARLASVAQAARQHSVLVVSDTDKGLENGSAINFVPVEDRVGFEVSIENAQRSNLRVSSRMLGVARRVVRTP